MAKGDVIMWWIKLILYILLGAGIGIVVGIFCQQLSDILKELKKMNKQSVENDLEKGML